ncbi:hypothetical protein SMD11_5743 [Streptomyces albireticuli]|uniref:Uncharacterized protein n=1 Tax=Streptomyces albireticuli TaxID=1940 RepID=A0A1Z2LAH1_9ACTN|nr:hypothetical protein SMD11_5743 [Streptomyces albireticuli]
MTRSRIAMASSCARAGVQSRSWARTSIRLRLSPARWISLFRE